ncbi:MAG: hypothetical protein ACOY90_18600 [Candidatus Zhuqueibacterota bacterium]
MKSITYIIRTQSPVVLSAKHGDMNMVNTEHCIPGNVVLGILAKRYIAKNNLSYENAHKNPGFQKMFLSQDVFYRNAYICHEDNGTIYNHLTMPCSIQKEKYGEEIFDLLYDRPDKSTKSLGEFCSISEEQIFVKNTVTSLNFHHARNRETGITEEGQIFNYESIDSGQLFQGEILGDVQILKDLADLFKPDPIAYIGRSRNAQYGKVSLNFEVSSIKDMDRDVEFEDEISLTLLSNTILYDENGFPVFNKKALSEYLEIEPAQIIKSFIKKGETESFVGVWKLKKPSESCFLAGSTFLLKITKDEFDRIKQFEKTGIGERTREGFGQCILGWQNGETLVKQTYTNRATFSEPKGKIPELTINVMTQLIKDSYLKYAEYLAQEELKEADGFYRQTYPTNSLIGRLLAILKSIDLSKINTDVDPNKNNIYKEYLGLFEKLRDTARKKLVNCKNREVNLLEFIEKTNINCNWINDKLKSKKEFSRLEKLNKISGKIDYSPLQDQQLNAMLYYRFYETLFSTMRKINNTKKEEKHGDK